MTDEGLCTKCSTEQRSMTDHAAAAERIPPDTDCDNDVGPRCHQLWPTSPQSWCEGCLQRAAVALGDQEAHSVDLVVDIRQGMHRCRSVIANPGTLTLFNRLVTLMTEATS